MVQNGSKWSKMVKNGQNGQIGQNGQKWSKIVNMVKNGQNGLTWSKMGQHGPTWSKLVQMVQICPKGPRKVLKKVKLN